jgi:hypothetical protein
MDLCAARHRLAWRTGPALQQAGRFYFYIQGANLSLSHIDGCFDQQFQIYIYIAFFKSIVIGHCGSGRQKRYRPAGNKNAV